MKIRPAGKGCLGDVLYARREENGKRKKYF
jgi:hypothetical protein